MPKINIRESDNTKPGSAGAYANHSVLIPGFAANELDKTVYEFDSQAEFVEIIGIVKPGTGLRAHYGNRMAYELLGLGYPIIYVPIDALTDLENFGFWEPFYDKASYDFRFITHGCIDPTDIVNQQIASLAAYLNKAEPDEDEATANSGRGDCIALLECPSTWYSGTTITYNALADIVPTYEIKKATGTGTGSVGTLECEYIIDSPITGSLICVPVESSTIITAEISTFDHTEPCTSEGCSGIKTIYSDYQAITASNYNFVAFKGKLKIIIDATPSLSGGDECYLNKTIDAFASVEVRQSKLYSDGAIAIRDYASTLGVSDARGTYCAMFAPYVTYKMSLSDYNSKIENGKKVLDETADEKFPGAFHYLACFKNALDRGFAEWYATAGYTRGVSKYVVASTPIKLGERAIQLLEPRNNKDNPNIKCAVNVIACFRGAYYLWGNRTMHQLGEELTAQHFLNIRQLCTTIKKQLYVTCRSLTFDPNSDMLWTNFCNAIRPMLTRMLSDQGIKDFKLEKVYTDKKATLKAKIRIIPIEAVEDFILEVSLEDSFGDINLSVAE